MSRCFPFPPPGYEKKTRTDNADLVTKEKQKEKKRKKEKRDEDKREGKEKKDKDRSKEKRREKKDRKEKHKDKKKDEDRDKDKTRSLDKKRIEGQPEGYNGEKLGHNSQSAEETKDSKFVQELGRRIRNDEREAGNQMVEKFAGTDQRRPEGMGRLLGKDSGNWAEGKEKNKDKRGDDRQADGQRNRDEERSKGNAMVQNFIGVDQRRVEGKARPVEKDAEKRMEGKEKNQDKEVSDKFVQELGRRIRDDENKTGNQMVDKFTGTDQRRAKGMGILLEKGIGNCAEGTEKNKDKGCDNRRADEQRNKDEERGMGNAMVQNFTGMDQRRVEGMARSMEKDAETRMDGKEKNKDKEGGEKQRDKHKNRDRDKKSKGKDKDRDKEKKKEKEVKEKSEHKNKEHDKLRERGEKIPIDALNIKPSQLPEQNDNSAATKGNLGKRKNFEMNGFLHDNDVWPTKLPRPASSTHLFMENGRTLEQCSTGIQFASNRQVTANNCKLGNKDHKVNGVIEAQISSVGSTKPSLATVQANVNAPSMKPPHPDSKYLSQILSVPKMEQWPDFDDQEWLFSCDNIQSKKPKAGSTRVGETPQVWEEALQIESADVCALPYVIPY